MSKTYKDAIQLLRSRIRPLFSGPVKNRPNNFGMSEWLTKLGYQGTANLDVIHITGTKGKGSTAALTDSLIREHFHHISKPVKVGLYTSPHLISERERIRINFQPLSEDAFTRYFFEVWDILYDGACSGEQDIPGYLQLLCLLSLHVFEQEKVDVAIYEVHAGGRKDATNIFDRLVACGFTTIGMDHIGLLGQTVKDIAWHKSGIMKHDTPAFSVVQEPSVREVLTSEATKLGCSLTFIGPPPTLPPGLLTAQNMNASLATCLANTYLKLNHYELNTRDIQAGIERGTNHWFLDCAHNTLSIPIALEWFESMVRPTAQSPLDLCPRVLVFGHESTRDTHDLIKVIVEYCNNHDFPFDRVILSSYDRYGSKVYDIPVAEQHATFWRNIQDSASILCTASASESFLAATQASTQMGVKVLVCGSIHLVGDMLELLQNQ
ncbi:putative tetrahydrofolylpolyglutamate synthase [Lasiosphaeria ovina]|uniref:tetrahydrofolate synthase n=1 Tax=Lasiosphaeria ovina TaxID=92902 RepID=A0AAE0K812_9PEZI|nr:putative tetrahydrofolylpolyglutamate synthase [Lasiosphaeria ovina]